MATIALSGYPEAVLGRSSISVSLPSGAVAADAISAVAAQHDMLGRALLHADSSPRRSTKVLLNGIVADLRTPVAAGTRVTVLAALPCDG